MDFTSEQTNLRWLLLALPSSWVEAEILPIGAIKTRNNADEKHEDKSKLFFVFLRNILPRRIAKLLTEIG